MTKDEAIFQGKLRALGCIVCRLHLCQHEVPASIHHLLRGGRRIDEWHVLGLCHFHHQGGCKNEKYVSRHPWKKEFEKRYGTEMQLLAKTKELIA